MIYLIKNSNNLIFLNQNLTIIFLIFLINKFVLTSNLFLQKSLLYQKYVYLIKQILNLLFINYIIIY